MSDTQLYQKRFGAHGTELREYLGRIIAAHNARGMAVTVIDWGETIWEETFGYRDAEKKLPICDDTLFGIASVTKSFTALCAVQLAERGVIDLNAPVHDYVPEFKNAHQGTVRVAHFLSHVGGYYPRPRSLLSDLLKEMKINPATETAYDDNVAQAAVEHVAAGLDLDEPRLAAPGLMMSYCNDGFGLISDIIRRKGGAGSYAAYLDANVLEPLGMNRSTCRFIAPAKDDNAAILYSGENGNRDYYNHAFMLNGGGALKSTLSDLKKYLRMYLNRGAIPGGRLLSAAGVGAMVQPRVATKHHVTYGYGLMTNFLRDITVHRHGGSLPGVSSHIAWSPELGVAVIVLCNTDNVPVALAADALLRVAAGWGPEPDDTWIDEPWSDDLIARAVGTYHSGEGALVEIRRDGAGVAIVNGGELMEVRTVRGSMALLTKKYSTSELHLLSDEAGRSYAVRLNDRIVPRRD